MATLQTLPVDADALQGDAGQVGGFSLHAGVAAQAHERDQLERLCRYITRPAISERRLSISPQGRVGYQLKTPQKKGTTHVESDQRHAGLVVAALAEGDKAFDAVDGREDVAAFGTSAAKASPAVIWKRSSRMCASSVTSSSQ